MNVQAQSSRRMLWLLLAAGLLVRLPHLGMPPIGVHSWRQSDTAAIARNFHENGYRFAMPQVDWGGSTPGYVESEFPLYPYTAAIAYRFAGVHEIVPRSLSVVGYLLGACALYALVNRVIGVDVALWSVAFFLFLPLNLYYSRAIMPEAWMIASSIGGVNFFQRWTQTSRVRDLVASGLLVALAALLKLPALYLALPLAYLAWLRNNRDWWRQPALWAYASAVLAAVAGWYLHAHDLARHGVSFGIWGYGSDKWGNWGLVASPSFWNAVVFRSLAERWLTWVGFPLFVAGLFLPRRAEAERVFDVWLLAILIYFVIVARGNFVHEYYQFPFLPAAVVYLGKVFARAPRFPLRRVALSLGLIAIGLLSGLRYAEYLSKENPARSPEVHVAMLVRECADRPNDRIVTAEDGNPTLLYLSHRKGWIVDQNPSAEELDRMRREGARCLAGTGPAPPSIQGNVAALVDGFGYVVPLRSH